jgi:hypothetical protein
MKSFAFISTIMLALLANILIAGNTGTKSDSFNNTRIKEIVKSSGEKSAVVQSMATDNIKTGGINECLELAPVTPKEAEFTNDELDPGFDFSILSPVIPSEADFE